MTWENTLLNIAEDKDREIRRIEQLCKECYYGPNIGGDMITLSQCSCGAIIMNENTNKDALCINCAKEKHVCKHCGKEMD